MRKRRGRKNVLLIEKLRTKAWANSFVSELQVYLNDCGSLSTRKLSDVTNKLIQGEFRLPRENDFFAYSCRFARKTKANSEEKDYNSQWHKWLKGEQTIRIGSSLLSISPFSEIVYHVGIPQLPCHINSGDKDHDNDLDAEDYLKIFDNYDAPPLWLSIKGSEDEIFQAWRNLPARVWYLWMHAFEGEYDKIEDPKALEWIKPRIEDFPFLANQYDLADVLEEISDQIPRISSPPVVVLTARIAAARLRSEESVWLGTSFPTRAIQAELNPFRVDLEEVWEALEEIGVTRR